MGVAPMRWVKVEPPEKFNGRGKPRASDWLDKLELWMRLSQIPDDIRIAVEVTATRMKEGPLHWLMGEFKAIQSGYRQHWVSWAAFRRDFLARFEPLTVEETACQ